MLWSGVALEQIIEEETVVDKADLTNETVSTAESPCDLADDVVKPAKKKFVKPEVSVPVDVLEATTFFQLTDSGPTN